MNPFEQNAAVRELMESYKAELPELLEKSTWYFDKPVHREAWLITYTRYNVLVQLIERLEKIYG